jgi:magnesium transporter
METKQEKGNLIHKKLKFRKLKKAPPGSAPGIITAPEGSLKPVVRLLSFNADVLTLAEVKTLTELRAELEKNPSMVQWIDIRGLGDKLFYEELADMFSIHRLEIEDVLSGHQRPKVEESEGHMFITSRMLIYNHDAEIRDEQVTFFLFPDKVISIHDCQDELFQPVKERLSQNRGIIRKSDASYLGYALMDAVVDNYFPFLERLGNFLDDLEDKLLDAPDRYSLQNIQASKRRLILFRRIAWSEREKLNDILRTPSPLFSDVSRRYLRDTYDHTIQVMDIIDSYREITASLMDIYLSSVSNKLNQVMKFLTVISTIFIPLTFIVGLYGMNFVYFDEATGKQMPLNMPELHHPLGYVSVWGVMIAMVLMMIYYFYKKGWLGER